MMRALLTKALAAAVQSGGEGIQDALNETAKEGLGMVIVIYQPKTKQLTHFTAGLSPSLAFDVLKRTAREIRMGIKS